MPGELPRFRLLKASVRILNLPGIGDSGPAHWQSLWEKQDPRIQRVAQRDWNNPRCADWVRALQEAVKASSPRPFLVAHSLGCLLVAHWAAQHHEPIGGALLVAPADPESIYFPPDADGFAPVPLKRLPFSSILVSSNDDPFAEPGFGQRCAEAWGSRLANPGAAGHINAESGVGDWPFGRALLDELTHA